MNILIQLAHPAHFHYYKNTIANLQRDGHNVVLTITSKDILEKLVLDSGIPYVNVMPVSHKSTKVGYMYDMILRCWRILRLCRKHHIDILTGSTIEVSLVGWYLRKPSINIGEDDAAVVGKYIKAVKPFIDVRLTPEVCHDGALEPHSVHFPGNMELGYLHPNHFTPSKDVVAGYGIDLEKPYFIFRFASLNAHHDNGIKGISTEIAQRLIDILAPHGQIYITSERPLEPQFEQYRIRINPLDIHHVMAFASLYIGDSQTMAAEAGVLGTPYIRFNDFVGRIGYLDELEAPLESPLKREGGYRADYLASITHHYDLGVGIRASEEGSVDRLCQTVERMVSLSAEERSRIYGERRQRMLCDKIDYAKFLTWFLENYPESRSMSQDKKDDKSFWQQFK